MDTQPKPALGRCFRIARIVWQLALGLVLLVSMACKWLDSTAAPQSVSSTTAVTAPATPATEAPVASQPAVSPPPAVAAPGDATADASGLILVYTKTGQLWRWQDGRAEALPLSGNAYAPRLSPDRRTVAFLRPVGEFHIELWAVDMDGSRERKLVGISDLDTIAGGQRDSSAVAINPYSFAWIPGEGQRLAFNTHQVYNGPGLSLLDDLHIVDAASGHIQTVLQPGMGGEFVFSPDGSRVAISKPDQIFLANADGSGYRQVMSYDLVLTYSEYHYYAIPKWSQDGSYLRVVIPPADVLADPAAQTALWRIPVDGGEPVREGGVQTVPFFDAPIVYSPDLQRVAFIRAAEAGDDARRALHLATFDGLGDWVAANAPMLRFDGWAPDGRSFVYTVEDEMAVFVGSLDAAAQPLGSTCNGAVEVRWVDPDRLICAVQSPGAFELMLVEPDGGSLLLDTIAGDVPVFDLAR